jgi:hypothetical protein
LQELFLRAHMGPLLLYLQELSRLPTVDLEGAEE